MASFDPSGHRGVGGMPTNSFDPAAGADYYSKLSPDMLNFGISAGQDILNRQKARWMPGVSDFWLSLKFYFAVRNLFLH